jgi:hypothetical protein
MALNNGALNKLERTAFDQIADRHIHGVNVIVDDPTVLHGEEFYGTPGQTDVFVYDMAQSPEGHTVQLRDFTPGEDYILLKDVNGTDVVFGDFGAGQFGTAIVMNAATQAVDVFSLPYTQAAIEGMVLPFNGQSIFDDPFHA